MYWNEHQVDVTIIPGRKWTPKSTPPLKRDQETTEINQNVLRIEAYTPEAILAVLTDMKSRFWKLDLQTLEVASDLEEDYSGLARKFRINNNF